MRRSADCSAIDTELESVSSEMEVTAGLIQKQRKEIQYDIFSGFLAELSETEKLPMDFDEKLFYRLVDYATVYAHGRGVFTFRNGAEVETRI